MGRNSRRKRSTRRQSRFASFMIVAAVVMVCIVSIVVCSDLRSQSRELAATERSLQQQIEQAELEKENLVAQEQYMKTNQYIEDVAKDKLGLVYPDEIVIKPQE
jgi:cell division protein FtsL